MLFRFLLVILIFGTVTSSFAARLVPNDKSVSIQDVVYVEPVHDDGIKDFRLRYRTEDILLLFKSCYETISFLGTTKYKRKKHKLTEEEVSKQCFCICDKVREKHDPKQFLVKSPLEIHNIIAPLANDCLKKHGQSWYDDVEPDKEKKDDSR